jgi:cytochrome c biogenesis protein CcmG, thiol:disulfide interchange protein DsbE
VAAGAAALVLASACRSAPAAPPADLEGCNRVARVRNASSAPLLPTGPCDLPAFDHAKFQELLAQLRGTPVVVNVWGSLCGPCITEAPQLARVAKKYEGRVQFLGVDTNDLRPLARGFILKHGYPYPSVFDPHRSVLNGLKLRAPPDTIIFDASGRLVFLQPGPITEEILLRELAKVVTA